ncbi:zinc finger BED domain-containing protein RICESLEEPER 1-like [Mangifera indica]|uniref:zinc finger BED domain-containing protein RICESLEEPER 1-like n=1 Tax=Mangifera indica TaxID=29780 RepID=UPI001CF9CC9D|nr:zinc finger BED domain-containing protein RICESLEEPER 1-like [Mangifera indica]
MESISFGSDPRFYFQVGKIKISKGMKCLQDLVHWCKNNLTPESAGILHESIAYLQSLQRQAQEIESVAQQRGAAPASFNVNGTNLHRGQVVESLAQRGEAFVSNSYINGQMNHKGDNSSCFKRKRWSNVWEDFTKYVGKDEKEWTKCKHCKKEFVGSSKSETAYHDNHLKSCLGLRNPGGLGDKAKEISLIDRELNDSDLLRKIIKYGLNGIKDDILNIYEQEKDKLHKYLEKLPGCVNVTIEDLLIDNFYVYFATVWYIDDNWELKKMIFHFENDDAKKGIIHLENDYIDTMGGLNENSLKHFFHVWNIDKKILSMDVDCTCEFDENKVDKWLNERASLPFIGNYCKCYVFLLQFEEKVISEVSKNDIFMKLRNLENYYITSSNKYMFELAAKKVESLGKKATFTFHHRFSVYFDLLVLVMGNKEAFCELEHTDYDFKCIDFDWDDATSLHSFWVVLKDMENDIGKLMDSESKLANECFPIVYDFFSKMLQFKKTENQYLRHAALLCREYIDEYCSNSKLLYVITVILDPRFKLDIVEHFYKEIYDDETDLHFKKIFDSVTNIYNEYAKDVKLKGRAYAFSQHANVVALTKSEFDRYLTDSKVPLYEEFDILEWWRVNSPTYPTLAMMARDFLSIPIAKRDRLDSSSLEDEIEDIYTSKLDVDLKCGLVCLKVWLNDHVNI